MMNNNEEASEASQALLKKRSPPPNEISQDLDKKVKTEDSDVELKKGSDVS